MVQLSCVNKENGIKQTAVCAKRITSESKEERVSTEHVLHRKLAKKYTGNPIIIPLSISAGLLSIFHLYHSHHYSSYCIFLDTFMSLNVSVSVNITDLLKSKLCEKKDREKKKANTSNRKWQNSNFVVAQHKM